MLLLSSANTVTAYSPFGSVFSRPVDQPPPAPTVVLPLPTSSAPLITCTSTSVPSSEPFPENVGFPFNRFAGATNVTSGTSVSISLTSGAVFPVAFPRPLACSATTVTAYSPFGNAFSRPVDHSPPAPTFALPLPTSSLPFNTRTTTSSALSFDVPENDGLPFNRLAGAVSVTFGASVSIALASGAVCPSAFPRPLACSAITVTAYAPFGNAFSRPVDHSPAAPTFALPLPTSSLPFNTRTTTSSALSFDVPENDGVPFKRLAGAFSVTVGDSVSIALASGAVCPSALPRPLACSAITVTAYSPFGNAFSRPVDHSPAAPTFALPLPTSSLPFNTRTTTSSALSFDVPENDGVPFKRLAGAFSVTVGDSVSIALA